MPLFVNQTSLYPSFAHISFASASDVTLEESNVRISNDEPSKLFGETPEPFIHQGNGGATSDLLVLAKSAPVSYGPL